MEFSDDLTWQMMAQRWGDGLDVISVDMGGMSDEYEFCIQTIIFSILNHCRKNNLSVDSSPDSHKRYADFSNDIVNELNDEPNGNFSGAQVATSTNLTYQFLRYGYAYMMRSAPKDRLIYVNKNGLIRKVYGEK